MTPLSIAGQLNFPFSNRLDTSTTPVPSQKISFTRSARFAEHVHHTGERIGAHGFAHQRCQPLRSFPEVDRLRRHQNPDIARRPDHEFALSARITASMLRGFASARGRGKTRQREAADALCFAGIRAATPIDRPARAA
jgi:hypothetical protein